MLPAWHVVVNPQILVIRNCHGKIPVWGITDELSR